MVWLDAQGLRMNMIRILVIRKLMKELCGHASM